MKLITLELDRLPGIPRPFVLDGFGGGATLIHGPNASGKSSTRRALKQLLFEPESDPEIALTAHFEDEHGTLRAHLSRGKVTWFRGAEEVARPSLPPRGRADSYAVGVRELLDDGGDAERGFAQAVARQMAGGYELAPLREQSFRPAGPREGLTERGAVREATSTLARKRAELADLAREEDRRDEQEAALEEARAAVREGQRVEQALELLKVRSLAEDLDLRLAEFPAGMARLAPGDEERRLDLEGELERSQREFTRLNKIVARDRERLERTQVTVEPDELARRFSELQELRQVAGRLLDARRAADAAEHRLAAAVVELVDDPARLPELGSMELRQLEGQFKELTEARQEEHALDYELDLIQRVPTNEDPALLAAGQDALADWLQQPNPEGLVVHGAMLSAAVLLAVGSGVAGFVTGNMMMALPAGMGLGLISAEVLLRARKIPAMHQRMNAEQRFRSRGLEEPASWTSTSVIQAWVDLGNRRTAVSQAERSAQRVEELERRLGEVRQRLRELEAKKRERLDQLGLSFEAADIEWVEWPRRLEAWRQAAEDLARARGEVATLDREHERRLGVLVAFCGSQGKPCERDAEAVKTTIDRLNLEANERAAATERLEENELRLPELEETAARAVSKRDAFYAERGLEPGDARSFKDLLVLEPRYRELAEERRDLGSDERRLVAALGNAQEWTSLGATELERRRDELARAGERLERLQREAGALDERLRNLGQSDPLAELELELTAAHERLAAKRDQLGYRQAGAFLLDDIQEEYERTSRPQVIERAADLFAGFTYDRFALEVTRGMGGPRFTARDTELNETRELQQLSDGTRMQLLLAVRLAFAESGERSSGEEGQRARVPVILDEAFRLSDNERFQALVESIERYASEGRQVIYLTADRREVSAWRKRTKELDLPAPTVIDLGRARRLSTEDAAEEDYALAEDGRATAAPRLPKRDGKSPAAYAKALRVALPEPWQDAGQLHLFHLLSDDLAALERVLNLNYDSLGRFESAVERPATRRLLGSDAFQARLIARMRAARALFDAWHVGRGRPLEREDLRAGGVTPAFLDEVEALSAERAGHPAALLAGLRDKRVKRFKASKIEELEAHCLEQGFLDPREELTAEQRFERVVRACEAELAAGAIEAAELRELADRLAGYLESGLPETWGPAPAGAEAEPELEPAADAASGAPSAGVESEVESEDSNASQKTAESGSAANAASDPKSAES